MGRAMGVKVARSGDGSWETSVTAVDLTKRGQEIFGKNALVCCLGYRPYRKCTILESMSRLITRCIGDTSDA